MCPMVRRPNGIELALLGFLREGPQHGYHIHHLMNAKDGFHLIWRLKQSQLYALLTKLEKDGFLTSMMQNQDPHPPRRVFTLTRAGHKVFDQWLRTPVEFPRYIRQEFLAKLYYKSELTAKELTKLIEDQKLVCIQFRDEANDWAATEGSFQWLVQQHRRHQIKAQLEWLDEIESITPTDGE